MTDTVEQDHVTAGFTIKVPSEVQYGSNEASVFVPITIPDGASEDDVEAIAERALGIAKRVAAAGVGVETTLTVGADGTETVVLELEKAFPDVKPKTSKPAVSSKARGNKGGGGGGRSPSKQTYGNVTVLNQIDEDIPEWLPEQFDSLVAAGEIEASDNEVWDNRKFHPKFGGNGNPNAPWFKTSKGGVALDFGGDPVDQ